MSHSNFNDLISKIFFLDQNCKRTKHFSNLTPFKIRKTNDIIEIQKAATKLAHHIGLDHLTFVVNYSSLGRKTGGQIELDNESCVLISISESILDFHECVLATLAHEISHKYLHLNKLAFELNYENEIFTDLAAVYLGFGKIMLKGRFVEQITEGYNFKHTRSQEVGYLTKRQLSFIYLAVNILFNVSPFSAIRNISFSEIPFLLALRIKYRLIFLELNNKESRK
jgi:hypothetical protein